MLKLFRARSLLLPALAAKGANVTAVCSGKNAEKVHDLGANQVIDYRQGSLTEQLPAQTFDLIYDLVGGTDVVEQSKSLLSEKGKMITTVGPVKQNGKERLSLPQFVGMMNGVAQGVLKGDFKFVAPLSPNPKLIDSEIVQTGLKVGYEHEVALGNLTAVQTHIQGLQDGKLAGKTILVNQDAI